MLKNKSSKSIISFGRNSPDSKKLNEEQLESKRNRIEQLKAQVEAKRTAATMRCQAAAVRRWMQIPLARYSMKDHEINFVIPVDIGVGYRFEKNGHIYVSQCSDGDREVQLEVTSWRGVSIGAIHFYGKLKYWGISYTRDGCDNIFYSGIPGADEPIQCQGFYVELTRKLIAADFQDKWSKDRFLNYEVGDPTTCFNDFKSVIRTGRREFKRIFGPGWKLIDEYREGDFR